MAEPIGPGDFVECVNAAPDPVRPEIDLGLEVGRVYRVEDVTVVGPMWINAGEVCLVLAGANHPFDGHYGERAGYNPDRFRKLYTPRADLIESLLAPAPAETVYDTTGCNT